MCISIHTHTLRHADLSADSDSEEDEPDAAPVLPGEERSHAVWFPPKKKENTPVAVAPQRRILSAKNASQHVKNASQHAAAASPRKGWAPGGGAAALAGGGPVGHTRYNGYNGYNGNRGVTDRGGASASAGAGGGASKLRPYSAPVRSPDR